MHHTQFWRAVHLASQRLRCEEVLEAVNFCNCCCIAFPKGLDNV